MKFHLLYASSVSACFELENTSPYYAETAYDVAVNGAPALLGVRTNVFSLFDLQPETPYSVAIGEESISFVSRDALSRSPLITAFWRGDAPSSEDASAFTAEETATDSGRVSQYEIYSEQFSSSDVSAQYER